MCSLPDERAGRETAATITLSQPLGGGYHRLRFAPDTPARTVPGQFVMVRVRDGVAPLLRRPFSIHMVERGEVELLYREVGEGTAIMTGLKVGDIIDVLQPLGRGFGEGGEVPLLVGGGIGVAPLLYLAHSYLAAGKAPKLLLGGRTERDILCHDQFSCLAIPTKYATEDGSLGDTGLVTALLEDEFKAAEKLGALSVHACGPVPMLAAVARLAEGAGVACEVSLEAHMACGLGACLGCVVKARDGGYVRVCADGPVFDSKEILWP
ncbi:MAG: dihydroorotate dehydrogenase electron transfer subunit [Deltaproteobacteria bacterium]|nr:MAG: dihydroorotate dehydrogenase electron transfer subunit [Deltaproteobacteria bacterium]